MMASARSQTRKLILASLALVVCRIVSAWNSIAAGSAAVLVLAVLAASVMADMPRTRRVLLRVMLPITTLANAFVFALGAFGILLAAQGLLVYGRTGRGPAWNWAFALVPTAAAVNLAALGRTRSTPRWTMYVWLVNLASACYAVWHWRIEDPLLSDLGVPVATMMVIGLVVLSLTTLTWDGRDRAPSQPVRSVRRRVLMPAALVIFLLWLALVPAYRKRQLDRALDAFGLSANFGIVFPGWRLPFELRWEWYDYLGEVSGASAPKALKGDANQAGSLLNTLPWLAVIIVNELPADGSRLLQPLAGHKSVRQIALKGPGVTDETLADAARLPAIYSAVFDRARITDDGLASLAGAIWLQRVAIRRTPISGAGLVHLRSLPRLAELELSGTDVGDQQIGVLTQFTALRAISLNDTPLTDDGLAALASCKTLTTIDLSGTRVTAAGVESLRKALPGCTVVWNGTGDEH